MDLKDEVEQLKESLKRSEHVQVELDRRVFHLKTLYDVGKDIFATVDFEGILKNFFLMTMGNFGVMYGFILTLDFPSGEISHFESMGFQESDLGSIREGVRELLMKGRDRGSIEDGTILTNLSDLHEGVVCALPFTVGNNFCGILGLGPKLSDDAYNEDDNDLLVTLINNLVVSLKNAQSFEDIKRLNQDLQEKNVQLEKTLKKLQAALRKVEILESIKANLSKFVPTAVTRMIEKSPTSDILDAKERDVSILFLDIEGYTKLSEKIGVAELNELIEKYFSVFMEAIYANDGDVNETAGDGLMVLFPSEDETTNALNAVRAALTIREKAAIINQEDDAASESLVINMGINSGRALLGAAKFDSLTGSRWTYTARGMVTNVAARIGDVASEGAILISRSTSERIKDHLPISPLGKFSLKNVSEEVELFAVEESV